MQFDHEKLKVYQLSLDFNKWTGDLLNNIKQKIAVCSHLDESAASITQNIAEGNGKFTSKDRCKYFDISRGSALECASCLDLLVRRGKTTDSEVQIGKRMLIEIVSMLVGLIKSNSNRTFEPETNFNINK